MMILREFQLLELDLICKEAMLLLLLLVLELITIQCYQDLNAWLQTKLVLYSKMTYQMHKAELQIALVLTTVNHNVCKMS